MHAAGLAMVQLFEDYPVTESLLLWYPTVIVAAELTLPLVRANVDESVQRHVLFASTSLFMTLVNYEAWHFMILYAPALALSYLLVERTRNKRSK